MGDAKGDAKGIWFVYRSHYEGTLSKRVRRLRAGSILEWFREKLGDARRAADPPEAVFNEIGGYVYGFGTVFEAVKEHDLRTPKSTAALEKLLHEHLYVEGGPENILLDDHTLRVLTDDDEVSLAYFFFDDEAVKKYPDRVAYLLLEDPRLPDGHAVGPFAPPRALPELLPKGDGAGATYACLFTFYDGDSMPGTAAVFPGVRLPELAPHMRRVVPLSRPTSWSAHWLDTWPIELRLLRAMLDPSEHRLAPALARCAAYPLIAVGGGSNPSRLGVGDHETARGEFVAAAADLEVEGDPDTSIVHEGDHVAVLCAHMSTSFGYQQWILFDDRWGAAHPDLASSILRYATGWDPFPSPGEADRKPGETAASRQEQVWTEAVAGRTEAEARAFRITERFASGELVNHTKFGLGAVSRVEPTKIDVIFRDATRTLAHGTKT